MKNFQINTILVLLIVLCTEILHAQDTGRFYKILNGGYAWMDKKANQHQLLTFIKEATYLGLNVQDYDTGFIEDILNNNRLFKNGEDSMMADIRLTDAAILFFKEVAFGNRVPETGYNGLNYQPDCFDIPALLAAALTSGRFGDFLSDIELKTPEYLSIKMKLVQYNNIARDTTINKAVAITSVLVQAVNKPLILKLYQSGIIDSPYKKFTYLGLKQKVKEAQRLFGLMEDGILHATVIRELNVPLSVRIQELSRAINTLRWLHCARQQWQHIIVVNIPSALLLVYDKERVTMATEVIVGKRSTRTPVFISKVTEVILYPYWVVPPKIASRELLPLIRKDIGYLSANNMQVINQQGKIVNPRTINWDQLSSNNFPYTLRQSTGCDNSLGIVKLNFFSPYGVYLHDTPWKVLFNFNKRYYSHGCIRVKKAIELAHLVLKDNTIAIDTLEEKGCLNNQRPIIVPASEPIPVFVLYNTAWVDSAGVVRFYENVYNKVYL
jgi:L,D-transpeptidase YcbB